MLIIEIHNEQLAQQLEEMARSESRPLEEIIQKLLNGYARKAALEAMDGMFDDDITDLSTSIRETMQDYYRKHNEGSS